MTDTSFCHALRKSLLSDFPLLRFLNHVRGPLDVGQPNQSFGTQKRAGLDSRIPVCSLYDSVRINSSASVRWGISSKWSITSQLSCFRHVQVWDRVVQSPMELINSMDCTVVSDRGISWRYQIPAFESPLGIITMVRWILCLTYFVLRTKSKRRKKLMNICVEWHAMLRRFVLYCQTRLTWIHGKLPSSYRTMVHCVYVLQLLSFFLSFHNKTINLHTLLTQQNFPFPYCNKYFLVFFSVFVSTFHRSWHSFTWYFTSRWSSYPNTWGTREATSLHCIYILLVD